MSEQLNLKVDGILFEKGNVEQVNDSFKKIGFAIEVPDDKYPNYLSFEAIQDKCDILDNYKVGDRVTVSYNLTGRKYVDKHGVTKFFNSLKAWRVETPTVQGQQTAQQKAPSAQQGNDEDPPF